MPEMSSMTFKKKLYNTRLRNKKEDLGQIVSGATKDITDITKLLLSLNKYRAEVMNKMDRAVRQAKTSSEEAPKKEGILGSKPRNVKSVADMMLFDSDINVYEESNVELSQAVEFNIRGKKQKYFSQKELDEMAAKRNQILKKQQMLKEEKAKLLLNEQQPITMIGAYSGGKNVEYNDFEYIPQNTADVELGLEDNLFGEEQDNKYEEFKR